MLFIWRQANFYRQLPQPNNILSPVKQTQRAVTLCEICLSLAVFSTAIGCWIKFSQIQKQQQIGIRTQLDIPIYVDAFEHMLDTTSADKLGQWFAWKDPSTNTSRFLEPSPRVPQAHLQSTSQPPSNFPKVPLKLPCDLPIRKTHFNTSKKFSAQQRTKIMHIQY